MLRNILNKFAATLYVQLWENRLKVTNLNTLAVFDEKPRLEFKAFNSGKMQVIAFGNSASVKSTNPFSHPRVLLADFLVGERLLQEIIRKLTGHGLFSPAPRVIVHPMEKTEGGLTQVEIRAFREMAAGAGARSVVIYQGPQLEPASIDVNKLSSYDIGC